MTASDASGSINSSGPKSETQESALSAESDKYSNVDDPGSKASQEGTIGLSAMTGNELSTNSKPIEINQVSKLFFTRKV